MTKKKIKKPDLENYELIADYRDPFLDELMMQEEIEEMPLETIRDFRLMEEIRHATTR